MAYWRVTATWQLPTLPRVPEYWRATPTECGSLLGEAGVVEDEDAAGAEGRPGQSGEGVAGGAEGPGALVDELLQALLVVEVGEVDAGQAVRHGLDALAVAVEEEAAEVQFGPPAAAGAAEVGQGAVEEVGQVGPEAGDARGVHRGDILRARWAKCDNRTE